MIRRHEISNLKASSERVGRLYPILLDKRGNIIDGRHRFEADNEWPKVTLEYIETDEQMLIARLIGNVCRRQVQSREKTKMLDKLGDLYLKQGARPGEIACKIAEATGMSYRWVMKYMPARYKARPGIGGPSGSFDACGMKEDGVGLCSDGKAEAQKGKVVWPTADDYDRLLSDSKDRVLKVKNYNNTDFVSLVVDRRFYMRLEKVAREPGIETELVINNIFHLILKRLEGLSLQRIIQQ